MYNWKQQCDSCELTVWRQESKHVLVCFTGDAFLFFRMFIDIFLTSSTEVHRLFIKFFDTLGYALTGYKLNKRVPNCMERGTKLYVFGDHRTTYREDISRIK